MDFRAQLQNQLASLLSAPQTQSATAGFQPVQQQAARPTPIWFGGALPKDMKATMPWASPAQNSTYPELLALAQNPLQLPTNPMVQPTPQPGPSTTVPIPSTPTPANQLPNVGQQQQDLAALLAAAQAAGLLPASPQASAAATQPTPQPGTVNVPGSIINPAPPIGPIMPVTVNPDGSIALSPTPPLLPTTPNAPGPAPTLPQQHIPPEFLPPATQPEPTTPLPDPTQPTPTTPAPKPKPKPKPVLQTTGRESKR